jgi:hypothetical protein
MSALTLPTSRKQWHRDENDHRGDVDPDRKYEIHDDGQAYDGDEPDCSITQSEAALHVSSIGLPRSSA